jgi:hypothetical protein
MISTARSTPKAASDNGIRADQMLVVSIVSSLLKVISDE